MFCSECWDRLNNDNNYYNKGTSMLGQKNEFVKANYFAVSIKTK